MLIRVALPLIAAVLLLTCAVKSNAACVWKVTAPNGGVLYLGGSIHALKPTDYPLPPEYNRAFDASSRLVFEIDPKANLGSDLTKTGEYPKGDTLKNHVDPRSYDYLRRLFRLMNVPEATFSKYRPWFLQLMLSSAAGEQRGISRNLGVETFLARRAMATSKPTAGLESLHEHIEVLSGVTDRQGEALLLLMFVPQEQTGLGKGMTEAWRRGDADALTATVWKEFQDFPSLGDRLLSSRNRKWLPQLEDFAKSGRTAFVVVGAGHLGGENGLLKLLRERGYQVTKL